MRKYFTAMRKYFTEFRGSHIGDRAYHYAIGFALVMTGLLWFISFEAIVRDSTVAFILAGYFIVLLLCGLTGAIVLWKTTQLPRGFARIAVVLYPALLISTPFFLPEQITPDTDDADFWEILLFLYIPIVLGITIALAGLYVVLLNLLPWIAEGFRSSKDDA